LFKADLRVEEGREEAGDILDFFDGLKESQSSSDSQGVED
jgi:hypothetical protein